MRQTLEPMLHAAKVNMVFAGEAWRAQGALPPRRTASPTNERPRATSFFRSRAGHVHAYERSFAVNNKAVDATGAIHITIGDGGNREGLCK
jgi:hypothetical protein